MQTVFREKKENDERFDNILGLIGNTPLVKLNEVTKEIPAKVYAKIESFNPGHSTKDRIALHIIEAAERKGLFNSWCYYRRNHFWKYGLFYRYGKHYKRIQMYSFCK